MADIEGPLLRFLVEAIESHRLSWTACGILAWLLSRLPETAHTAESLARASPNEPLTALFLAVHELAAYGYVSLRDPHGSYLPTGHFRLLYPPAMGDDV